MSRPVLLDLFCGEGGAAMGYHLAGFEVIGYDIAAQPKYPFEFHRVDALDILRRMKPDGPVVAIHASPPCQRKTRAQRLQKREHPRLIEPVRVLLREVGLPYVIENVVPQGADDDPLIDPALLCGAMFGLQTYRHRQFETSWGFSAPAHPEAPGEDNEDGPPREGRRVHACRRQLYRS